MVHNESCKVAHLEGREFATAKVIHAGSVNEVELVVLELGVENSGVDATLLLLLQLGVVRQGVACLHGTFSVDNFAFKGKSLGKSGLARTRTANDNYVAEIVNMISFHCVVFLC